MITIRELLNKFDIDLKLPDPVMDLTFEENYSECKQEEEEGDIFYVFTGTDEKGMIYEIQINPFSDKFMVWHTYSLGLNMRSMGTSYGADGIWSAIS